MKRVLIYGERNELEKFHRIHDDYMGYQGVINFFTLKGLNKFMYAELIGFENDTILRAGSSIAMVALFDENNNPTFFNNEIPESEEFNLEQALFAVGLEKEFKYDTAEATLSVDIEEFEDTSDIIETTHGEYVSHRVFDPNIALLSAVALSEKIFGERIHAEEVLLVKTSDNLDEFLESKKSLEEVIWNEEE